VRGWRPAPVIERSHDHVGDEVGVLRHRGAVERVGRVEVAREGRDAERRRAAVGDEGSPRGRPRGLRTGALMRRAWARM